ncbi:RNA polymerase sigma factor [Actinoallomurus rhizosphaericola]|uniref:RNA polymerase sigma factor n=1 Tax=Actinoallomurus rhizosphaericola TaxID=2952536 RepID=UPI002090B892|nr:RNA polymerase sigma factor [Actinoallomurus rhizosphaericola]MCO5992582.1 RNA polymerase sigma factor [Actinoallomurus rhizosphaericola]
MERTERARLRAGDPAAFSELFDAHAQAIYRYAARSTGDLNAAEDVVSLTFLEAWRLRGRLEPGDAGVLPWLFGLATNVLRNQARAARRHRAAMSRMPRREQPPDFTDKVIGRMADAERVAAARAALEELSDADREVIALCVWAGLDYTAAAEALGVPVGTVRSRLSRARAKLRTLTTTTMQRGKR